MLAGGVAFDQVVTGDMVRHRQTAEACLAQLPQAYPASSWLIFVCSISWKAFRQSQKAGLM